MMSAADCRNFTQAPDFLSIQLRLKMSKEKGALRGATNKISTTIKGVAFKGTLNIKLIRSTSSKSNKKGDGEKGNLFQTIQRQMRQKADTELKKWSIDINDI